MEQRLTETEVRTRFITPAIRNAGWESQQIREEVPLTAGKVKLKGNLASRGEGKFADYVLYYKQGVPLAVVEAKHNRHTLGKGMPQALEYAEMQDVLFAYSSNGTGFLEHDFTKSQSNCERKIKLDEFPSPDELWRRYLAWKEIKPEHSQTLAQDYYTDPSGKAPRYYQLTAINKTIEAVTRGQNRILLVMATGTGKTYTAFQIIWRLWKSKANKRILYLADRNILIDQTRVNDFKPFGDAMTKIENRTVDKAYQIYLSLYQAVSGHEEARNIYKQFPPDFFDLIVVDECHRGSAAENSAWRAILNYFSAATHIGMTATPKETSDISTTEYFGEAIYTYSLKQGIEDGFLAPYKIIRVRLDIDEGEWRPTPGMVDRNGNLIPDRIYNVNDTDREIIFEQRTRIVAKRISDFLKQSDRFAKTIVFCEDQDHAERMRSALANENADLTAENRKYVMRITSDDRAGKLELDNFINPENKYPVIVTTSELMTTGVDAQTCKLIVLDSTINSMTKFKQIIGRGTRINEEHHKQFFTIMDFKNATKMFYNPQFDGEPEQIYEPGTNDPITPPDEPTDKHDGGTGGSGGGGGHRVKYIIDDQPVEIIGERVEYHDRDGTLITESLRDYTRKKILNKYASLDTFLKTWNEADRKQAIVEELEKLGVVWSHLASDVDRELDPFDMICHIAFDKPPLTRRERANKVRKRGYFAKHENKAKAVLEALLEKYADEGIKNVEDTEVLNIPPLNQFGSLIEIIDSFGGIEKYNQAIKELEDNIYNAA
ncbi:MAG TPA: DEAD/DEAH box helicase family protein [Pyrinomonadaceae bacterium]